MIALTLSRGGGGISSRYGSRSTYGSFYVFTSRPSVIVRAWLPSRRWQPPTCSRSHQTYAQPADKAGGEQRKRFIDMQSIRHTHKPTIAASKPSASAGSPAATGQPASGVSGEGRFSTSEQTPSSPHAHRLKRPPPQSYDPPSHRIQTEKAGGNVKRGNRERSLMDKKKSLHISAIAAGNRSWVLSLDVSKQLPIFTTRDFEEIQLAGLLCCATVRRQFGSMTPAGTAAKH